VTSPHQQEPRPAAAERRDRIGAVVAALIGAVVRLKWLVIPVSFLGASLLGLYAVDNFKMNTDATDMLSPELEFRRDFEEYRRAFPFFSQSVMIVVEADNADRAEDGADALYRRIQFDRGRFHNVFYPESDPFFQQNGLLFLTVEELQGVANRLAEAQPLLASLSRDPSLRGLFEVLGLAVMQGGGERQTASFSRALDQISAVIEAQNQGRTRPISWKELMGGDAAREDRQRIIVLQPELDFDSLAPAADAMREIRRHARELGLTGDNGYRVRMSGPAAIDSEEIESVSSNTELSSLISFLLVAVLLVFCFRSVWLVLCSLITLVIGLVCTAAFAAAAIGSFNLISVAFAVLFIGIGVDFSIHMALRYREMAGLGLAGRSALEGAGRSIGKALALMAGTAALGFFSFLPTDYRGVSELGAIAGFSMIVAFITNLTVLPALLALVPLSARPQQPAAGAEPQKLEKPEHWLWSHSRMIVVAGLVTGLVSLALLWGARFDRNPLNLKDTGTESVATAIDLLKNPRLRVGTISVLVDSTDALEPLAAKLRALPSVASVRSIRDYVPRDQEEKLDIIEEIALQMTPILSPGARQPAPDAEQRAAAITGLRDRLRQILDRNAAEMPGISRLHAALDQFVRQGLGASRTAALEQDLVGSLAKRLDSLKASLAAQPVNFASLPENLRQREISPAGKVRLEVSPKEDIRDNQAMRRFVEQVRSVAPNATGGPVVELLAGDAVVEAFAIASVIAFLLITSGLFLLLRNITDLLLILAPLLLASALTVGIAVAVGLSFNFANIIVLPLLIGLGVSSGVHLVIRARRDSTIELLNTTTPRAVLFSAFTTIVSFASLALSSHWGQASMGLLLLIAITVNLICYLIVLPALLALVEQRRLARLVAQRR
jgi:hopanoid biosynthesis associated RND transporter like protein HpnN